jgi:HEPN domain-containing protein
MKSALDLARGLRTKAEHDLRTAEIVMEHDGPLDTIAFHLQQAAEKLLKALLASRGVEYPRTHDLEALLDLVLPDHPDLDSFRERLLGLSSYAVEMRYDATLYPNREEVLSALETVKDLRRAIHRLLPEEPRP